MMFHSLKFLARSSDSEMRLWPNSPLLVLLQFVDPNVHLEVGPGGPNVTPLHSLVNMAEPNYYSTHENQLILAKQLIEHRGGASVNAATRPESETPIHSACSEGVVTNLDFIELLLEKGAHPNAQDRYGLTPLMYTTKFAPGAAKFLLNWPTTDANITTRSGASFLATVRGDVKYFSNKIAHPDNPKRVQHQFWLRQWSEIEEMLVERGAVDTGMAPTVE